MSEGRFPIAVQRLLSAGNVKRVDLYAGRLLRNGEGAVTYDPVKKADVGTPNGNNNATKQRTAEPDHS